MARLNHQPTPDWLKDYLIFERHSLWTALGHANLAILLFFLPLRLFSTLTPRSCSLPTVYTPTGWLNLIVWIWCIACGIEFLRRALALPGSELKRSLIDTLWQNLPGLFLAVCTVALSPWALLYLFACLGTLALAIRRMGLRQNQTGISQNTRRDWKKLFSGRPILAVQLYAVLVLLVGCWVHQFTLGECDTQSPIKGRMHSLANMLEQYGELHAGHYPADLSILMQDGLKHGYWRDITPYYRTEYNCAFFLNQSCSLGYYSSYLQLQANGFRRPTRPDDWVGLPIDIGPPIPRYWMGLALYDPINSTRYFIYGVSRRGELLIDKGKPFVLSNS